MSAACRVLVIGYGNPGRRDDGLGPALAAALEQLELPNVTVDADYQLTVEDAARLRDYDVVIFSDAACAGPAPLEFKLVEPGRDVGFSTHSIEPDGVLGLSQTLFKHVPRAYTLAIRGYEFDEFGEGLSPAAQTNLSAAIAFLRSILEQPTLLRDASTADLARAVARCAEPSGVSAIGER